MGYNVTNNNMNIKHELLARHLTAFATENEGRVGDATARFWIGANGPTRKPGRGMLRRVFVSCLWGGTGNYKLEI